MKAALFLGVILALQGVVAVVDDEEFIANGEDDGVIDPNIPEFVPTDDWQDILPGQPIPPGLHIRISMETGRREAKLMTQGNEDPLKGLMIKEKKAKDKQEEKEAVKPATPEQLQELRDLYEHLQKTAQLNDHGEILKKGIGKLEDGETSMEDRMATLEMLEEIVSKYEYGVDFVKLGGLKPILNILNNTAGDDEELIDLQTWAVWVLGTAAQNNPHVQDKFKQSDESVALIATMLRFLTPQKPELGSGDDTVGPQLYVSQMLLANKVVYALSALVRAHGGLQGLFAEASGPEILSELLSEDLAPLMLAVIDEKNQQIGEEVAIKEEDEFYCGAVHGTFLKGYSSYGGQVFSTWTAAMAICLQTDNCGGVTCTDKDQCTLRADTEFSSSSSGERSYLKSECFDFHCQDTSIKNSFLEGYSSYGSGTFKSWESAMSQCLDVENCGGVTCNIKGDCSLRSGVTTAQSASGEESYLASCFVHDDNDAEEQVPRGELLEKALRLEQNLWRKVLEMVFDIISNHVHNVLPQQEEDSETQEGVKVVMKDETPTHPTFRAQQMSSSDDLLKYFTSSQMCQKFSSYLASHHQHRTQVLAVKLMGLLLDFKDGSCDKWVSSIRIQKRIRKLVAREEWQNSEYRALALALLQTKPPELN